METRMKPGGQTVPPSFSERFAEESERWRLRYFLHSGFQDYNGGRCTAYRVALAEGVGEDEVYGFLKKELGGREIPAILPEAAYGRTLEIFRAASAAGLLRLEVACVSERATSPANDERANES